MEFEVEGRIIEVLEERSGVSANGSWRIASYVLQTLGSRPHNICFDVSDGRDGRIERMGLKLGEKYKVKMEIDANEYHGKWFNKIKAFMAEPIANAEGDGREAVPHGTGQGDAPFGGDMSDVI